MAHRGRPTVLTVDMCREILEDYAPVLVAEC